MKSFSTSSRQHVARQRAQQPLELEVADMRRDLGEVFVADLGRSLVHDLLEAQLVSSLVRPQDGQALADRHEIARTEQRVAAQVLERVLLLARVRVRHRRASEESREGIVAHALGIRERVGLHEPHVVDEDLAQARRRIRDVDRAAAVLLRHDGGLREPRVRLLADRGEHLDAMVDAAQLVGDLDQPELREMPDVRRELAGHARMLARAFDVLVEVLVDAVDEQCDRRVHRAQARDQMAVGVGSAALQLARREVEQPHEVVDRAVEPLVGDQASETCADLEIAERVDVLQRR
jgi:hypothetical protein